MAKDTSDSVLDCFVRLGVTLVPWDLTTDLTTSPGPVWDHVLVCEKGHFIPFDNLHEGVKVFRLRYDLTSLPVQVNAFPSTSALDRKDKLWTCYTKLRSKMGRRLCHFLPENYNLPEETHQLMARVCM